MGKGEQTLEEKEPGLEDMQAKNEDIRWGPNNQKSNLEIEEKRECVVSSPVPGSKREKRGKPIRKLIKALLIRGPSLMGRQPLGLFVACL